MPRKAVRKKRGLAGEPRDDSRESGDSDRFARIGPSLETGVVCYRGARVKNQTSVNLFLGQHPNFSKIARELFFVHATFSTPIPREKFIGFGIDDFITKFLDGFFCPYISEACFIMSVWGTLPGRGGCNQFFRAQSFETTELTVWPCCRSGSFACFLQNGLRVAKQNKSLRQAKVLNTYGPISRLRSYPDRIPLSEMQVFGLPCLFLSVLTRHGPRFFSSPPPTLGPATELGQTTGLDSGMRAELPKWKVFLLALDSLVKFVYVIWDVLQIEFLSSLFGCAGPYIKMLSALGAQPYADVVPRVFLVQIGAQALLDSPSGIPTTTRAGVSVSSPLVYPEGTVQFIGWEPATATERDWKTRGCGEHLRRAGCSESKPWGVHV